MLKKAMALILVNLMLLSMMPTLAYGDSSDYENHWASTTIEKWKDRGIIIGYEDGSFKPQKNITRAEFAQIMVRIFGYTNVDNSKVYSDVNQKDWFYEAVNCISSLEIMYGYNENMFRPNDIITREEATYAMANAYKVEGQTEKSFEDEDEISKWAMDSVKSMLSNKYVNGTPGGYFNPQDGITRAELIQIIDNITGGFINEAGIYTSNIEGNLVVNTRDVILKDMTVEGDLYLAEGIGDGDITMENIEVKGKVFVEGGGENSIIAKNSKFLDNIVVLKKSPARIVVDGDAVRVEVDSNVSLTLSGNFAEINVAANSSININNATIDKIVILESKNKNEGVAKLNLDSESKIGLICANNALNVSGKGTIENLVVNANGVVVEQKVDNVTLKDNVEAVIAGKTKKNKDTTIIVDRGDNNDTPSVEKKYYTITGKVTAPDGTPVKYVKVHVLSDEYSNVDYTDADGNYSITVRGDCTYTIDAGVISEDNKGYGKTVKTNNISSDASFDLQLQQVAVVRIYSVDKNDVPFANITAYKVVDGVEEEYSFIRLYAEEVACEKYILASEIGDDDIYNFKYEPFGSSEKYDLENVSIEKRQIDEYLTELKVIIDAENKDTFRGSIIDEEGKPVEGAKVELWEQSNNISINHRHLKQTITTNSLGQYCFENIDKSKIYTIMVDCKNNEGIYIQSGDLDARLYENIVVRKVYSVIVTVVDANGVSIPNVYVYLTINGEKVGGNRSEADGVATFASMYIQSGIYEVHAEIDGKTKVAIKTIEQDDYLPKEIELKFDDVVTNNRKVTIDVGDYITIGDLNIPIDEVSLEINGEYYSTSHFTNGKATIYVPEFVSGENVRFWILKNGTSIFGKEVDLTSSLDIKLSDYLHKCTLSGKVSIVTTGGAITSGAISAVSITVTTDIGGNKNVVVAEINPDSDGSYTVPNLIEENYKIVAKATIGGITYSDITNETVRCEKDNICDIVLKPLMTLNVEVRDKITKELLPNAIFIVEGGEYKTDANGRCTITEGFLIGDIIGIQGIWGEDGLYCDYSYRHMESYTIEADNQLIVFYAE